MAATVQKTDSQGIHNYLPGDIEDAFFADAPELDFCLPGFLMGSVGALIARGGLGKSFVALAIAILLTCGVDLLGLGRFRTGRVLYLAAEDPWIALCCRLKALGGYLSDEEKRLVAQNLEVRPLAGASLDLIEESWSKSIVEAARGARLIVIDTLRRAHSLDENCGADMARLVRSMEVIAQRSGASVLFLHHANKASYADGGDSQGAARGSSVLVDNIRWQSFLCPMLEQEARKYGISEDQRFHFVKWGVSKQNFGKPVGSTWLRREADGVLTAQKLDVACQRRSVKEVRRAI